MKNFQKILVVIAFFTISNAAFAQTTPKVIAVISKASWCPACIKNEGRVGSEVVPNVDKSKVQIVINDLSDKTAKADSKARLNKLGLDKVNLKATGLITFIDPMTKKVKGSITVDKSSDEILKAIEKYSL